MKSVQPVANGISTDHPVPGLPFVDDSGIDIRDPRAIEALGRHRGTDTWGRWDGERRGDDETPGSWWACTTIPDRTDLAWCVRFHPEHGRSVLLVRDEDASNQHTAWEDEVLLLRAGGYWWDGDTWYRPSQVFDWATERFVHRKAKGAVTVTAADLLDHTADAARATLATVAGIDPAATPVTAWIDHLALWADHRPADALPADRCVVNLSAPELAGDQLIGATELAAMAGIEPSTLRAYQARGETDLPDPQAVISGRNAWSKPVAADWIEQRNRSAQPVAATMSAGTTSDELDSGLSRGQSDLRQRFTGTFFSWLWNPARRKSWVLRRRNEESVKTLAGELAWYVASDLDHIIPTAALAYTIRCAVIAEFADDLERQKALHHNGEPARFVMAGIAPKIAIMLDWLIRHHPTTAAHTINEIIGDVERTWNLPRKPVIRSLKTALSLDGKLPDHGYDDFFALTLPPEGE